jgi:environmental stress-induced protein Ves
LTTPIFTIIPASKFKTIPWKNGKGNTIELAINEGGNLDSFEWRLSMASVVEDGVFSDFSGYLRNLILIKGEGIELIHDDKVTDKLSRLLTMATFDGACKTMGKLTHDAITDFNIITNHKSHNVEVNTYLTLSKITLPAKTLCFIYCLDDDAKISLSDSDIILPAGDLGQLSANNSQTVTVSGQKMIVVILQEK